MLQVYCSASAIRKGLMFLLPLLVILFGKAAITSVADNRQENMVLSYGLANKVIVIDPGHGGIDSGASRGNLVEQEITLQIGKKLADSLSQGGAMVILLRENESDLAGDEFTGRIRDYKKEDLKNRVKRANEAHADMFISIHTNAVPSTSWSGAQTFYKPANAESKIIAKDIQEELSRVLGNTKRSPGAGNFYVLKNVAMPAVMVEAGFISNPEEGRLLSDSSYQSRIAYAIAAGIARSQADNTTKVIKKKINTDNADGL